MGRALSASSSLAVRLVIAGVRVHVMPVLMTFSTCALAPTILACSRSGLHGAVTRAAWGRCKGREGE